MKQWKFRRYCYGRFDGELFWRVRFCESLDCECSSVRNSDVSLSLYQARVTVDLSILNIL